jgi:hypothetical protein
MARKPNNKNSELLKQILAAPGEMPIAAHHGERAKTAC